MDKFSLTFEDNDEEEDEEDDEEDHDEEDHDEDDEKDDDEDEEDKERRMMMMRIPKICSFHCIFLLAISDDLTHCIENIRIGGNPMIVHEISQLENH